MDIVQEFFDSRSEIILDNLTGIGFSFEKSKNILILVTLSFALAVKELEIEEVLAMLIDCDLGKYLNQFDIDFMAQLLSMNREDVIMALEAIWPIVCGIEDASHHKSAISSN